MCIVTGAQHRQAGLQQPLQAGRRDDCLQRPASAAGLQRSRHAACERQRAVV